MDSRTNTRLLKEKFYNQHIKEYFDFVQDTDLSRRNRRGLSKTLVKLNDQVKQWCKDKELFSVTYEQDEYNPDKIKEKRPYLKINATETEMVISVEEFFLIIDKSEDIKEKVDQILRYTEVESGNGSIPELEQTTEDTIIRSICDYFWKRYDKIDIERKDKKDVSKDVDSNYHYEDLKTYTYEDIIKIIGGIISTINSGTGVVNFLHICRKIRNIDVHNGRFFGLKEGYEINCFRLFTYMATVLLLRKSLERKGKMPSFKFDKITMPVFYPKGSSCEIKLYSGDELIRPQKNKDGVVEYEVEWYRLYRLDISKYNVSKERIFTWNEFYPCAKFDGATLDIENAPNASSGIHNRSFHHVAESLKVVEDVLVDIDSKTGSIDNTVSNIDTKLDILIKYGQNNSEIVGGLQSDVRDGFQKLIESFHQFINKQNGPLDLDIILKLLVEQYESKHIEIERKRKRGLILNSIVLALLMALALFSFISSILCDHSILWLSHKSIIITIVSISFLLFVLAIGGFYKFNNSPKTKKLSVSICLPLLLALLIGGSYIAIPYKTAKDFVDYYDFSEHDSNNNLKAADYLENLRTRYPENGLVMAQLTNYYLNYSDCIEKAVQVSRPLENVEKYDYLSEWAAVVAFQIEDYEKSLRIIENYNKFYNHSTVVMNTLYGAMFTFGKGVEQDIVKGVNLLVESSKENDALAHYYLARFFANDNTIWDNYNKKMPFCDLKDAIYYYRKASNYIINASLELGNIFSDLSMNDSAHFYYNNVLKKTTKGTLRDEALYRMGLIEDIRNQTGYNSFLSEAISHGYTPAISYYASKQKDCIAAINAYEKIGTYSGYRYLSPIAIKYLESGAKLNETARDKYREKAKFELLKCHPDGKFDDNFILGLECLLGLNYEHNVDSITGMNYINLSAQQGCLFADMICEFCKQEKLLPTGVITVKRLAKIGESIPFAHVLLSYLMQKANHYDKAKIEADNAMRKGHPGGAIMFVNMLGENDISYLADQAEDGSFSTSLIIPQLERAMRIYKNKKTIWQSAALLDFSFHKERDVLGKDKVKDDVFNFWSDIAIANQWEDICIALLGMTSETNYKYNLIESILKRADETMPNNSRIFLTNQIDNLPPSEKERLMELYGKDSYKNKFLTSYYKPNGENVNIQVSSTFWKLKEISIKSIIYEFSEDETFIMPQYLQ